MKKFSQGITLVEVIFASSIILVAFLALITTFTTYQRFALSNVDKLQATLLAGEGIEALRLLRDDDFTGSIASLTASTTYYFAWSGSDWTTTSTNTFIDSSYERKFVLFPVYRDGSDQIASSGTLDANSKHAVVTVSWASSGGATTSVALSTYLTNLFAN